MSAAYPVRRTGGKRELDRAALAIGGTALFCVVWLFQEEAGGQVKRDAVQSDMMRHDGRPRGVSFVRWDDVRAANGAGEKVRGTGGRQSAARRLLDGSDESDVIKQHDFDGLRSNARDLEAALNDLVDRKQALDADRRTPSDAEDDFLPIRGRQSVLQIQKEAAEEDAIRAREDEPRVRGRPEQTEDPQAKAQHALNLWQEAVSRGGSPSAE
ncbi:hypothetical protein DIPPA_02429 [Diplonema papillatum]|nr:hypothetical protein DIPPA_02429 [Diplonema papillatum]